MKEQVSRKWKNWYQNEVDEEKKGADSRDKAKHNGRSDQIFFWWQVIAAYSQVEDL